MRHSEVASRYATAIFDLSAENKQTSEFLQALQCIGQVIQSDKAIQAFVSSPLIRAADKEEALKNALSNMKLPSEILDFVLLLAQKDRLFLMNDIVSAYQAREDRLNNVTRGTVKSAVAVSTKQKEEIQKFVDAYTQKKVLLQYVEDKSLVGGLSAQVGSLSFDDSVVSHLKRMKEDLTRSNL
jgi:F-type H+-transporting ATPase subunit delta